MIFANMRLYPGMIDTSTETAGWILSFKCKNGMLGVILSGHQEQCYLKKKIDGWREVNFLSGCNTDFSTISLLFKQHNTSRTILPDNYVHWSRFTVFYSGWTITVMSNERRDTSVHLPLVCVFSSLFRLTSRKYQCSTSLPIFGGGIHWWPVNPSHKGSLMRKTFPCYEVVMTRPVLCIVLLSS